MDRRADRAIAVSAIAAVAIVPTVLLVALKVGESSPKSASDLPPAAAAAQHGPDGPETASASPTPSAKAALPKPVTPLPPGRPPAAPPVKPFKLKSYTRHTDARFKRIPVGGTDRVTENSRVGMKPRFAINTKGRHERTLLGITRTTDVGLTVQGNVLTTTDGRNRNKTKLTSQQLAQLKGTSDPRVVTFMVALLPGATKKGPDKQGRMHYSAKTTLGNMVGFLPQNIAGEVLRFIPSRTPVVVNVWADNMGRPSTFTLTSTARTGTVTSRTIFRDYK